MSQERDVTSLACIIPTWGRPKPLERTLRSLESQSVKPHEVFVVLQGADEPLSAPIRLSIQWLRQTEPNAQKARNNAVRAARSDLLLFLDDDIEADPHLIQTYLELFRDATLGAVCGAVLESGQELTAEIPRKVRDHPMGWLRFPLHFGGSENTQNFSSCNTCVRKEIHLQTGGFDENFLVTIFDDSDWSIRLTSVLAQHRLQGRHEGRARILHFRESSGGRRVQKPSFYVKMDAEAWASKLYFWRKNYGFWAWGELARMVRMDLLGKSLLIRPTEALRAWGEFFQGWKWASRRMRKGPQYG